MHLFNLAFEVVGRGFIFGKWEIVNQGHYPFLILLHAGIMLVQFLSPDLGQLPSRFRVIM